MTGYGLSLLLLLAGCTGSFKDLTRTGDDAPSAARCGECHVEIFREWRASTHAESWQKAAFREQTFDRTLAGCLGCHAPDTIFGDDIPALRPVHRDEGVSCVSCHFSDGKLAGPAPASALVDPHPVAAEEPLYRKSELCGRCHEGTLAEWRQAPVEGRKTCQECHMPPVTRTLTQGTGVLSDALVSFEDEYEGRRHSFHLDAIAGFEGGFDTRREGSALIVTSHLPHLVPTGDFGFRRFAITLEALDAKGRVTKRWRKELFKELGESLRPEQARRFETGIHARRARLRLTTAKRDGPATVVHEQEWQ